MIRVFTGLHWVLWSAMVTLLVIALTFADSTDAADVLKRQLVIGLMILAGGGCALLVKEPTRRCWIWIERLTRLSDDNNRSSIDLRVTMLGRWAVLTSCAIGVVAFLRFCKHRGWGGLQAVELYTYHSFVLYVGPWLLLTAAALAIVATTLAVARRSALRR
ncbi:MAG: hypothetical protein HY595_03430 [Candidatus Omnitrophica bacterium]|nr:hypothetical protein [Candidatus Omnitrophota bacterium]